MNPKSSLNKSMFIISILLITTSFLNINVTSAANPNIKMLTPIYRNSSGYSSIFVINNTGTANGNFGLDYYLENDSHVASENKQIAAGQSLTIDLSQSAPFPNDPFTGYVNITADVLFAAEILLTPTPAPTPTSTPTPTPTTTASPSPSLTNSPVYSPTPEPQQTEPEIILGVAIVVAVFCAGLGLLFYLVRRR